MPSDMPYNRNGKDGLQDAFLHIHPFELSLHTQCPLIDMLCRMLKNYCILALLVP